MIRFRPASTPPSGIPCALALLLLLGTAPVSSGRAAVARGISAPGVAAPAVPSRGVRRAVPAPGVAAPSESMPATGASILQDELEWLQGQADDARVAVLSRTRIYRRLEAEGSPTDSEVLEARADVTAAEARLRELVAAVAQFQLADTDDATKEFWLSNRYADLERDLVAQDRQLNSRLQERARHGSDVENAANAGYYEGGLAAAHVSAAAIYDLLAAVSPRDPETRRGRTVTRLEELAVWVADIDPNNTIVAPGHDPEIARLAARRRQDLALRQFQRLAAQGLVVDDETGQPVDSTLRLAIARNAERNLNELLEERGGQRTPLSQLLRRDDYRPALARQLEEEIENRPSYQLVAFLDNGLEPTPEEYFLAAARAIRTQQEYVNDWYVNDFVGGEWYNVGLGKLLRASDAWGTAGRTEVERRVRAFMRETDAAASALEAAAANDPGSLDPAPLELLRAYGYVIETGDGGLAYQIPDDAGGLDRGIGRQRSDLQLPGASWLDVVNLKNVGVALTSVVVPELVAARVAAAAAEGLELGAGSVMAVRVLTEMAVGTAVDGTIEYAERGDVDWERLILESAVLGSTLQVAGAVNETVVRQGLRRIMEAQRQTRLYQFMRRPEVRERVTEAVVAGFGLANETAITATFQTYIQDGDIDLETVLSTALQGAMSRKLANEWGAARRAVSRSDVADALAQQLPEPLRQRFDDDPAFRRQITEAVRARVEQEMAVRERYEGVVDPRLGPAGNAGRVFLASLRGDLSWSDLKRMMALNPEIRPVMGRVKQQRDRYFARMVRGAQDLAIADIHRIFDQKRAEAAREATSEADLAERVAALERRRDYELALVNEGVIVPGSRDPTSDIDRSAASTWVRRHLRTIYDMQRRIYADAELPTSARSFDVNEYINVLSFISDNREFVSRTRETRAPTPDGESIRHVDAMYALSLAARMQYMTVSQLDVTRRQLEAGIERDVERLPPTERREARQRRRAELDELLRYAQASLAQSQAELSRHRNEVANEIGRPADDPEVDVLARDRLYDERMSEINELQFRLEEIARTTGPDSDEAIDLRAEIERRMSIAMRDGIETYSQLGGLDLIVNLVQQKTRVNEAGETVPMKVSDLLDDPTFTLESRLLSMYTRRDIEAMHNDQLMFMVEHVNAFNSGHEFAHEAGRAMGKYLERAFLAMKLTGLDIAEVRQRPVYDPTRRLLEASQALVRVKADPVAVGRELARLSPSAPRTAENGMFELMRLMHEAMPGMRGLTSRDTLPGPRGPDGEVDRNAAYRRMRKIVHRNWANRRRALRGTGGAAAVATNLQVQLIGLDEAIARIEARIAQIEELGGQFLQTDWNGAIRAEEQLHGTELLIANVPWRGPDSQVLADSRRQRDELEAELERYRSRYVTQPGDLRQRLYEELSEFALLSDQLAHLRELRGLRADELDVERQRAAREAELDALDLSGDWAGGPEDRQPAEGTGTHAGGVFRIELHWEGRPDAGPHFRIVGEYRFGRLRGHWEGLHDEPFQLEGGGAIPPRGSLEAVVGTDGSSMRIVSASRHPNVAVDFGGMVFRRTDAAGAEPADEIAEVEYLDIPQEERDDPDFPRDPTMTARGLAHVRLYGPSGREMREEIEFYDRDTDEWVEAGRTFSTVELPRGEYRVRFLEHEVEIASLVIRGGAVSDVAAPQWGRLAAVIRTESLAGRVTDTPVGALRVFRDRERVRYATERDDDGNRLPVLPAGNYEVVADLGSVPVTTPVRVEPGREARLILRPAIVRVDVRGWDGSEIDGEVRLYQGDAAGEPLIVGESGAEIMAPAGTYDIEITGGTFWNIWRRDEILRPSGQYRPNGRFGRIMLRNLDRAVGGLVEIRRDVPEERDEDWRSVFMDSNHIDVPPGAYELRWSTGGPPQTERVVVGVGGGEHAVDISR